MTFIKVASINEIKPGSGKVVNANGIEIALFNVDGNFYAIDNTCPHRGGPLGEGVLDNSIVTCPLHGWRFDVTTGKHVGMPVNVDTFEVKVEGDDVFVNV